MKFLDFRLGLFALGRSGYDWLMIYKLGYPYINYVLITNTPLKVTSGLL